MGLVCVGKEVFTTLHGAHDYLTIDNPHGDVDIEIVGTVSHGMTWRFGHPGQRIHIHGGEITGKRGWAVAWRSPAVAHFSNVTVSGFERGGIASPGARMEIEGCDFHDMGSRKRRPWSSRRFGIAAVYLSHVDGGYVRNSTFTKLTNTPCVLKNCPALIHGVYLKNGTSNVSIVHNDFQLVSGDPIRISNGVHHITIKGNIGYQSGQNALVSAWGTDSMQKCHDVTLSKNVPGRLYRGGKSPVSKGL